MPGFSVRTTVLIAAIVFFSVQITYTASPQRPKCTASCKWWCDKSKETRIVGVCRYRKKCCQLKHAISVQASNTNLSGTQPNRPNSGNVFARPTNGGGGRGTCQHIDGVCRQATHQCDDRESPVSGVTCSANRHCCKATPPRQDKGQYKYVNGLTIFQEGAEPVMGNRNNVKRGLPKFRRGQWQ